MFVIDVNDFWTQALAAIAAALVMLFIQADWIRRPDREPKTSPQTGGNNNHRGNQAVITDNEVGGSIRVEQQYTDNSQRTSIINNVNNSTGASASSDDWGKVFLIVVVGVVAAVLFVVFRPLLQAVSFGAMVGVLLMLAVAVLRTSRLRAWTARGVFTVGIVCGAAVLMVTTWTGINTGSAVRIGDT